MASKLASKELVALKKELEEKQGELRAFRFGSSGNKSKNVKQGRTLRREIAQILTELGTRAKQNN